MSQALSNIPVHGGYPAMHFQTRNSLAKNLALMCHSHDYVDYDSDIYISGDWAIAPDKREGLIGKTVVLYPGKGKNAYLGGTIIAIEARGKARWKRGKGNPGLCAVVFKRDKCLDSFAGHLARVKGQQNVQYF
tara:strand:+ start:70 stop:468 length:399 start_codon:yes stop_codon:yes gene_type:complete